MPDLPSHTSRRSTKDERIVLRASHHERDLIARASIEAATSVSEFVLGATLERARDVLAERREFRLPPSEWAAFVEALDAPPATPAAKPRLHRLLTEPSMLELQAAERSVAPRAGRRTSS